MGRRSRPLLPLDEGISRRRVSRSTLRRMRDTTSKNKKGLPREAFFVAHGTSRATYFLHRGRGLHKPLRRACLIPGHPWNWLRQATGCVPPRSTAQRCATEGEAASAAQGGVPYLLSFSIRPLSSSSEPNWMASSPCSSTRPWRFTRFFTRTSTSAVSRSESSSSTRLMSRDFSFLSF